MKTTLLPLLLCLVISCTPKTKDDQFGEEIQKINLTDDQLYYYNEFKLHFFRSCLNFGYNSHKDREFLNNDASGAADFPLGLDGYKASDSLAIVYMEKIKADSIHIADELSDVEHFSPGDKRVLRICLEGYDSKVIDSVARVWARNLAN